MRNLITIEDSDESQVLVVCYADSGMARLIQYIASAADLDEWHLHATEIFSGLLKAKGIVDLTSISGGQKCTVFITEDIWLIIIQFDKNR